MQNATSAENSVVCVLAELLSSCLRMKTERDVAHVSWEAEAFWHKNWQILGRSKYLTEPF